MGAPLLVDCLHCGARHDVKLWWWAWPDDDNDGEGLSYRTCERVAVPRADDDRRAVLLEAPTAPAAPVQLGLFGRSL